MLPKIKKLMTRLFYEPELSTRHASLFDSECPGLYLVIFKNSLTIY